MKSKIVILCLDALNPKILNKKFKENKLPNLNKLKTSGTYSKLETVNPPQSPVAWASFITGQKPLDHGVLDFVTRNTKTYLPQSVYSIQKPLKFKNPFWKKLEKNNLPLTILFLPNTFPAPVIQGKVITGMGTPDVFGTMGSGALYSTANNPIKSELNVLKKTIPISKKKINHTFIYGPMYQNITFKKQESKIPLTITKTSSGLLLSIKDQKISLKPGDFSNYIELEFKISFLKKIPALVKFFLKSIDPEINLYLLPLTINPKKPIFKISHPDNYGQQIANKTNLFSTLGLPYDNKGYEQEIYSKNDFLKQVDSIFEERSKILFSELKSFRKGYFIFYEGLVDIIQHMFWSSPKVIDDYYEKLDKMIGKVLKYVDKTTNLFLLSDHGFAPFDYQVNVNNLLKQLGYLDTSGSEINWKKTKAYGVGFNSLYLNLKGREFQGIVPLKNRLKVLNQLKKDFLKQSKYIQSIEIIPNQKVLNNHNYPDLIIGYKPPYRASWKTAIGLFGNQVIEKRNSNWNGDHLFEKSFVPGAFLSNKKIKLPNNFSIKDVIKLIFHL